MANKTCIQCKKSKPFSEFHKSKLVKDGRTNQCKACKAIYMKQYQTERAKTGGAISSLSFLINMRQGGKGSWTLGQVTALLAKIKSSLREGNTKFDDIFTEIGHSKGSCVQLLAELRKLARENQERVAQGKPEESLKAYWLGGRRYLPKQQNRLLVAASKK